MAKLEVVIGWQNNFSNLFSPKANTTDVVVIDYPDRYLDILSDVYDDDFDRANDLLISILETCVQDTFACSWYINSWKKVQKTIDKRK